MPSPLTQSLRKPGALARVSMQQITDAADIEKILRQSHSSRDLYELLQASQLALYRSKVLGHLLVGSTSPNLHDHERWHFLKLRTEKEWLVIRGDAQWHHSAGVSIDNAIYQAHLNITADLKAAPIEGLTYESMRLVQAHAGFGADWNSLAAAIVASHALPLNAIDRHELLHHYDAWLSRNPEYNGMPRDLVRRMHGLGALQDVNDSLFAPMDKPNIWDGVYRTGGTHV